MALELGGALIGVPHCGTHTAIPCQRGISAPKISNSIRGCRGSGRRANVEAIIAAPTITTTKGGDGRTSDEGRLIAPKPSAADKRGRLAHVAIEEKANVRENSRFYAAAVTTSRSCGEGVPVRTSSEDAASL